MNIDSQRTTRIRRALNSAAILAVLGLSALGLAQCRLVDDKVTGVDVQREAGFSGHGSGRNNRCFERCNRAFRDARSDEQRRHERALRKCDRLNRDKRSECRAEERKIHRDNNAKIEQQRLSCKRNCYSEGGGRGGR